MIHWRSKILNEFIFFITYIIIFIVKTVWSALNTKSIRFWILNGITAN